MKNIKDLRPSKKSGYKQGYYEINEKAKYIGKYPVIFRSSWEKKFCQYCDNNPDIIKWSSEPFRIQYFNIMDKEFHYYFPDYFIQIKKADRILQYVVEIKPKSQLMKPIIPKKKTLKAAMSYKKALSTYVTNLCKIRALKNFARDRNFEVLIITEKNWVL